MKNKKYLNIRIDGEDNVGVIDMGVVHTDKKKTSQLTIDSDLKLKIEGKVVEALSSHFDCPVTIINLTVKELYPITIDVDVIVKSDNEDHQEVVYLEETWLY